MRRRLTTQLLDHIPERVAAAPERVCINVVCVLIGVSVLASKPRSPVWSAQINRVWAIAMVIGGAAALIGYWNSQQRWWAASLARTGYLALLVASLPFGFLLLAAFGWRGVPVGLLFLAIAAAKGIRLLVSSAVREQVLRAGRPPGEQE